MLSSGDNPRHYPVKRNRLYITNLVRIKLRMAKSALRVSTQIGVVERTPFRIILTIAQGFPNRRSGLVHMTKMTLLVVYLGFVMFVIIFDITRSVNTPSLIHSLSSVPCALPHLAESEVDTQGHIGVRQGYCGLADPTVQDQTSVSRAAVASPSDDGARVIFSI